MVNACKKYYRTNSWQIEKGPDDWYPSKEVDGHWKEPTEKKRKINTENEQNVVTGGAGIRHNFGSRHETIIFGSLLY